MQFVAPGGYEIAKQNGGGTSVDSNPDPTTGITGPVTVGPSNPTIDAGMFQRASLGDFVWQDANQNGIQDEFLVVASRA